MNIDSAKKAVREKMKGLRDTLNIEEKKHYDQWLSQQLCEKVDAMKPKVVHSYLPMGSEIDLSSFLQYILQ